MRLNSLREERTRQFWWSRWDSNPRPPRCHRGALPTAPRPHRCKTNDLPGFTGTHRKVRHSPPVATFEYYHRKIARVYKIAAGISASPCRGTNLKIVAFAMMVTSEAARVAL